MFRYFSALRKEGLILVRDAAGLIILFLMPMVMVIILSMVQEFGWNAITNEPRISVLYVNEDQDSLGSMVKSGILKSRIFELVETIDTVRITKETARQKISKGEYQIGVIIPEGATAAIRNKVQMLVTRIVSGIMMPMNNPFLGIQVKDSVDVVIFFDPAVKGTFKSTFMSFMNEQSMKIESSMIFESFNSELKKLFPQFNAVAEDYKPTVYFSEIYPSGTEEEMIPTTTQHNVPSWTIFAMFFIVIPLTSSIIKEREEGSLIRLHTLPINYLTIFLAKVGVYLVVCFVQFILMFLSGIFILPLFGMPALDISHHTLLLVLMAICTSLAALGYGIMIGTLARTHQQAAAFGSVSVVILAAIGGLWMPIYFFVGTLREVASYSPLFWAHKGFIDILLRNATLQDIFPEALKLLLFFAVTIGIAILYRKLKPPVGS